MIIIKQAGFIVVCVLFVRLVTFFTLHPRMAVLVETMNGLGDKLFHFMTYFMLIFNILAFLGYWMFSAEQNMEFGTFERTLYTQFKMFTGEFPWPDEVPSPYMYVYLILYISVVFVILVNFLLAIVVDSYASVQQSLEDQVTEQNICIDIYDIACNVVKRKTKRYPSAQRVRQFLSKVESSGDAPLSA